MIPFVGQWHEVAWHGAIEHAAAYRAMSHHIVHALSHVTTASEHFASQRAS